MRARPTLPLLVPSPWVLLALVALAGCSSKEGSDTGLGPEPTVSITPATVSMIVGDTASVSATVSGSSASVTFTSSDASVVTVDAAGKLAAVGAGAATIRATAGSASATAGVTVDAATPTLDIVSITQDGQPVDSSSVSGIIDVAVEYDGFPNTANGVIEVLIGDVVVGSGAFPAAAAAQAALGGDGPLAVVTLGGTRHIQAVTNAVRVLSADDIEAQVPNGLEELTARIPDVVTSNVRQVTLNNAALVAIRGVSFDRTATDAGGTRWGAGDAKARFQYVPRDGRQLTAMDIITEGIGEQEFPAFVTPGVRVGETNAYDVTLSQSLTAGLETSLAFTYAYVRYSDDSEDTVRVMGDALDPSLASPNFYLDQVAGTPNTDGFTLSQPWFGADIDETAALGRLGVRLSGETPSYVDHGVGGLTAGLHYKRANSTDFTPYTNSTGLEETLGLNNVFSITWSDAIGNTRDELVLDAVGQPIRWGLDLTSPTLVRVTGAGYLGHRNDDPSGLYFGWTASDTGSGLSGAYEGRVLRYAPGLPVSGECVYGEGEACDFKNLDLTERKWDVLSLNADIGYSRGEVREWDVAGNYSQWLRTRWTRGGELPQITNFVAPSSVTGGDSAYVSADLSDDLEVKRALVSLRFDNWGYRIGKDISLSESHDTTFVTNASINEWRYIYSSMETTDAGGVPTGTVYPLTALDLHVKDASHQIASQTQSVAGNVAGQSLVSRYGGIADRLYVSGPSTIEYNEDGSVTPNSVGTFHVEAWAQNYNTYTLNVRFAFAGESWMGDNVLYVLDGDLDPTLQDNGGWYSIHYQAIVDLANYLKTLPLKTITGYAAIGADPQGNALMSNVAPLLIKENH